ncbi:MAG: ABC transporter ATP-binding protein [Eubacteriales bacterium]|nr:ABC transporter ATP-binding protein [Eubacteriales bacterium]
MKSFITKYKNEINKIFYMLRPITKRNKFYVVFYILWDCIYQPINTMLYVLSIEIVVNMLSEGENVVNIGLTLLIIAAISLCLNALGEVFHIFYFTPKSEIIRASINRSVFVKLKETDYIYFDNPKFYDEYTLTYNQYANQAFNTLNTLASALSQVVTVGALVGYIVTADIFILVIAIVSMIVNIYTGKKRNKVDVEREEKLTPIARITDYIQSVFIKKEFSMDVKSTKISDILLNKYDNAIDNRIKTNKKYSLKSSILSVADSFVYESTNVFTKIYICFLIVNGSIGVGSFVSMFSAIGSFTHKMRGLTNYYQNILKCILYAEKVIHFFDLETKIEKCEGIINANDQDIPYVIELKNVSFKYNESSFRLHNINMHIKKGEKIAIVGENGAGKTTFTKLLLRLYDADGGQIYYNGKLIGDYNINDLRQNIGVAFQESNIYSINFKENLSLYNNVDNNTIDKLSEMFNFDDIMQKNNATYESEVTRNFDEKGIVLSGGERQKVSIARLYAKNFGLLILDEPSSALDPLAEHKLNKIIFDSSNMTTTILIAHRLSTVRDSDCIYVFDNGSIIESGRHDDLINKRGKYYEMFTKQAEKYQEENK